mgnify:CR=1 FL=1
MQRDRLRQGGVETGARQARASDGLRESRPRARSPPPSSAEGHRRREDQGSWFDDLLVFRALPQPHPAAEDRRIHHTGQGRFGSFRDLSNVVNLLYDPERRIDVEWQRHEESRYTVKLTMEVEDRKGLARGGERRVSPTSTPTSRTWKPTPTKIGVPRSIRPSRSARPQALEKVIKSLRSVDGVLGVERAGRAG